MLLENLIKMEFFLFSWIVSFNSFLRRDRTWKKGKSSVFVCVSVCVWVFFLMVLAFLWHISFSSKIHLFYMWWIAMGFPRILVFFLLTFSPTKFFSGRMSLQRWYVLHALRNREEKSMFWLSFTVHKFQQHKIPLKHFESFDCNQSHRTHVFGEHNFFFFCWLDTNAFWYSLDFF